MPYIIPYPVGKTKAKANDKTGSVVLVQSGAVKNTVNLSISYRTRCLIQATFSLSSFDHNEK